MEILFNKTKTNTGFQLSYILCIFCDLLTCSLLSMNSTVKMVWLDFLNLKDNENILYNKSVNYHFLLIVYCIDFYQKPGTMNKN